MKAHHATVAGIVAAGLLAAGALVTLRLPQVSAEPATSVSQAALGAVDPVLGAAFAPCTARSGEVFLFTAVVAPRPVTNGFAPTLVPQGGPAPGSVAGYYQFALVVGDNGHYRSRIVENALRVTDADMRNGIDARFAVDLYAKSYRVYDAATRTWSAWTTAGSMGPDVHYGSFTPYRQNGQWTANGGFLVNVGGTLHAARCADIPKG